MLNITNPSKKLIANGLREVASTIQKHGWIKHTLGSHETGFCLIGAMHEVCTGAVYDQNNVSKAMARAVLNYWNSIPHDFPSEAMSVPYLNDYELETKEDALHLLRGTARWLEHGGRFTP